ncbi:hypothetical protein OAP32_00710 [Crocinitomicaceae bacterium]|nr:hypothetical protein [Crocinitomicaceae bacterium]
MVDLATPEQHDAMLDSIETMLEDLKDFTPAEIEVFEAYIGDFDFKTDAKKKLDALLAKEYEQSALADHLTSLPE